MRARNIKPGFFKNEELAECSLAARLCFAGLWTLADREGRLEDRPKRIKGELFAFDSIEVEPLIEELVRYGFVVRYEVDSARYLQVVTFSKHQNPHQRESRSVIPPPPGVVNRWNHDPVTEEQRDRILARDGGRCLACGATGDLEIDHVVPRSRGGTSDDSNLQVLCSGCNIKKCAKVEPRPCLDTNDVANIVGLGVAKDEPRHDTGIAKGAIGKRKSDLAGGASPAESGALNPGSGEMHCDADASLVAAGEKSPPDDARAPMKKSLATPKPNGHDPAYAVPACPYDALVAAYTDALPMLPKVTVVNAGRKRAMQARWGEVCSAEHFDAAAGLEWFGWYFGTAGESGFLTGGGRNGWRADFDFLMQPSAFARVLERGRYHQQ